MDSGTTIIAVGSDYDTRRAEGLRTKLAEIDGVDSVDFNYVSNKITVKFDPDLVSLQEITDVVLQERKHHAHQTEALRNRSQTGGATR